MYRSAIEKLILWKNDPERKPLILKGARQVGKTWLMKEFGATNYENTVYLSFDEEPELKSIFETNKNPHRLVELIGAIAGQAVIPHDTLIIFDEIQECPEALGALKYFREKANEYHIIAAGSLLGTLLAQPKSFPVGQVNIVNLYPLSFDEFLAATDEQLYKYYAQIGKNHHVEDIFHNRLLEAYNYYLIIGGMPECVASWVKHKDYQRITQHQYELISIYENDITKYNGRVNSGRILLVFRNIVSQLSKSNEKFIYGCLRQGARAREFEEAIEWLVSAGLIYRVYNVSKTEHPLKAFEQLNNFKLFLFDTGLLKYMAGIDNSAVLLKSDYQFKGALTENYVLGQLQGQFDVPLRFYAEGRNEIDFLIQHGTEIIPVEVKSSTVREAASFKAYIRNRCPKTAIRYSKRGYAQDGAFINIPLYLAAKTKQLLP